MADKYTRAAKSLEAITRSHNRARLEGQAVALFGTAERNRDRIKAEDALERQQKRQGVANILGTVAGVGAGIFAGPIVGAAVGAAVTGAGRNMANSGWRNPSQTLTFSDNREQLRGAMRPSVGNEIGIMANAATAGYQAGRFMDERLMGRAMEGLTPTERAFSRPEDFRRRGLRMEYDGSNALDRYVNSMAVMMSPTEAVNRAIAGGSTFGFTSSLSPQLDRTITEDFRRRSEDFIRRRSEDFLRRGTEDLIRRRRGGV